VTFCGTCTRALTECVLYRTHICGTCTRALTFSEFLDEAAVMASLKEVMGNFVTYVCSIENTFYREHILCVFYGEHIL
jgi:hypothetical protein